MYYGVVVKDAYPFMFRFVHFGLAYSLFVGLTAGAIAQTAVQAFEPVSSAGAKRAVDLAKAGRRRDALPLLRKNLRVTDKDLRSGAGFAGVRWAMHADEPHPATDVP